MAKFDMVAVWRDIQAYILTAVASFGGMVRVSRGAGALDISGHC
jgi:CRISPR/Cas system CMR-associated protein Cmr1 (group 7 of RAMP superfamily)